MSLQNNFIVIDAVRNSSGGALHLLRALVIHLNTFSPPNTRYVIFTDCEFPIKESDEKIYSIVKTPALFRLSIISQIYQYFVISTYCVANGARLVSLDLGSFARARRRIGVVQDALLFRPDLTKASDVGIRFSLRYFLLRLLFKVSTHDYSDLVFLSSSSRSEFISSTLFNPQISSVVISHGLTDDWEIDPQDFRHQTIPPVICTLHAIYVSPYLPYKNHEVVVNEMLVTAARRPDLSINVTFIGGKFPMHFIRRLRSRSSNLNIRFQCLPFVNVRDLQHLIKKSDIFIFASECEAFGVTLLEGMRLRSYIIASDVPITREILGDGGRYFSTASLGSLSTQILYYMDNIEGPCAESINVRQRAYNRSLQFKLDAQISALIKFIATPCQ
jgi:glycosyltransferase involved in cell wall biosynthesis